MVSDCGKRYQKDIFEDFRALVGCDFISDLPHKKNEVFNVMEKVQYYDYPVEQIVDFLKYVFNHNRDFCSR